jgi:hypothetical protein
VNKDGAVSSPLRGAGGSSHFTCYSSGALPWKFSEARAGLVWMGAPAAMRRDITRVATAMAPSIVALHLAVDLRYGAECGYLVQHAVISFWHGFAGPNMESDGDGW